VALIAFELAVAAVAAVIEAAGADVFFPAANRNLGATVTRILVSRCELRNLRFEYFEGMLPPVQNTAGWESAVANIVAAAGLDLAAEHTLEAAAEVVRR
jgi:hypothetical protein